MTENLQNGLDLGEAWIAAKEFNGPIDPALVKLRHKENVKAAEERRDQDEGPRGRRSLARDDHDSDRKERERKDRLETLLLAIAGERLAEKLRETSKTLDDIRDKSRELLERIERLLKEARRDYQDLMENAARHPVTGERLFRYADGRVETEDGRAVAPTEAAGVDFKGKTTGEQKDAAQSRSSELEQFREEVTGIRRRAESHQERMTDPKLDEEQREQAVDQAAQEAERMRKRLDEIGGRLEPRADVDREARPVETLRSATASVSVPSL